MSKTASADQFSLSGSNSDKLHTRKTDFKREVFFLGRVAHHIANGTTVATVWFERQTRTLMYRSVLVKIDPGEIRCIQATKRQVRQPVCVVRSVPVST